MSIRNAVCELWWPKRKTGDTLEAVKRLVEEGANVNERGAVSELCCSLGWCCQPGVWMCLLRLVSRGKGEGGRIWLAGNQKLLPMRRRLLMR